MSSRLREEGQDEVRRVVVSEWSLKDEWAKHSYLASGARQECLAHSLLTTHLLTTRQITSPQLVQPAR